MQDLRFNHTKELARTLAEDIAARLRRTLREKGRASLAVSGGTTPVEFFTELSQQTLNWQNVLITLVDERWSEDPAELNETLVRQHLLQNQAAAAYFLPLKNSNKTVEEGFMSCDGRLQEELPSLDYAVLGMGADGHTASWFPHSSALPKLLAPDNNAHCAPVLDAPFAPPQRISLTWSLIKQAKHLYLHFQGSDKNLVFAEAKADLGATEAMPVRQIIRHTEIGLSVYRTSAEADAEIE